MRNLFLTILSLSSTIFSYGQSEYLVIFTQDTSTSIPDKHFTDYYLKSIRSFAKDNDLTLLERKAEDGVFEQTTNTPAIYFINNLNFSLYKGRYTETNRLFNFIRSAYSIPKKENPIKISDVFVGQKDKTNYLYPIKVTKLTGTADKIDEHEKLINKEIRRGTLAYHYNSNVTSPYTSKKYYLDFHPHLSGNKLYLNTKVFSEFNCKKPIYESKEPFTGKIKDYKSIIEKAKKQLFLAINKELNTGTKGDAHNPLAATTNTIALTDLGINVDQDTNKELVKFPTTVSNEWEYSSPVDKNTPTVQFQIPNTIYMGEVKKISAQLNLLTMKGYAIGDITSLTLGDYGLDQSVLERILVEQFKTANISFKEIIKGSEQKINAFQDYEYLIKCDFTFVGQTTDEEIIFTLTPFLKDDQLYLQCQATFDIQMKRQFGIESGVGDSFEEDTVEFYINFILKNKQL